MKIKIVTALILLTMATSPAYAGNVASASSNAGANSTARANSYSGGNTLGSSSSSGGNTLSSSSSSGGNKLKSSLNSSLTAGSFRNTTIIQAGKPTRIPVGVPSAVTPSVAVPQLFGARGQTTEVRGVPLTLAYLNSCQPVATRKYPLLDVFATGISEKTRLVFSPNQEYYLKRKQVANNADEYGGDNSNYATTVFQQVETARVGFSRTSEKYTCLGIITVTVKKGKQAPLSTILSDTRDYALQDMKGFRNVYFISVPEAIAAAGGVSTSGSGFSVSPGILSAATNLLTAGTLSAGYSNSGGNTGATSRLGATFFVLSPTTKRGVRVTSKMLRKYYK